MSRYDRPTGAMGPREARAILYLQTERGMSIPDALAHPVVERARAIDRFVDAIATETERIVLPIIHAINAVLNWVNQRLRRINR